MRIRVSVGVGLSAALLIAAAPAVAVLTSSAVATAAPRVAATHHLAVRGDFDGDGKPDLVAAAPGGQEVLVHYSKARPAGSLSQWITPPADNTFDFGTALTVGDFNGDGYSDLAVGAPELTMGPDQVGAVFIYDGGKTGLHFSNTAFFGPDPTGDNEFGSSLAAGDLNGDGFSDLAVGNPGSNAGGDSEGSVEVLFGSHTGLRTAHDLNLTSDKPVTDGGFGTAVAVADVNGDGHKDLIVGEPGGGPMTASTDQSGDVQVLLSGPGGLGGSREKFVGTKVGAGGAFGTSLAAGDVNDDGYFDVVAGAPKATAAGKELAGKVVVFFGSKHGMSAAHRHDLSENSPGVPGSPTAADRFGLSVAIGDLNGDHHGDVIVGAPGAPASGQIAAGAMYIFRGIKAGLTTSHSVRLTQATAGIPGSPVSGAELGEAVTTLGTTNAVHRELLVGVPAKHKGGWIIVVHGGPDLVSSKNARAIKDSTPDDELGSVFAT